MVPVRGFVRGTHQPKPPRRSLFSSPPSARAATAAISITSLVSLSLVLCVEVNLNDGLLLW